MIGPHDPRQPMGHRKGKTGLKQGQGKTDHSLESKNDNQQNGKQNEKFRLCLQTHALGPPIK